MALTLVTWYAGVRPIESDFRFVILLYFIRHGTAAAVQVGTGNVFVLAAVLQLTVGVFPVPTFDVAGVRLRHGFGTVHFVPHDDDVTWSASYGFRGRYLEHERRDFRYNRGFRYYKP